MEFLSVIIPCFNHGKFLEECLQSINDNWLSIDKEVLVIDDCSTDDSFEVAEKLSCKFNFKLYKTDVNSKTSKVRNKGIRLSQGNLVVCLDADDKIPPNYFQDNYNNILMYNIDVSYNNSLMFGDINKEINWPEFNLDILRSSPFVHCSSMFKKSIFEAVNGFDENMLEGWEDYDYWLRVAKLGFKFKKCNSTFLYYRQKQNDGRDFKAKNNLESIKNYLRKKHQGFYLG